VRQKLREKNNGLSPNDHDTYDMRYWSCHLPTSPFHWGWDEEKSRKVVSVLTFTFHILNIVVINRFIFLKGAHITLFPLPPKLSGCDFKQWINDYTTPKDIEYMKWVKKNKVAMRKGASNSK
jgi:hypothetical protein